ncbi:MAG: hypothetical protein PHD73_11455 [Sediminibacterium sp.]|nr:hypothetical protein [Sediminibacterium sp.]
MREFLCLPSQERSKPVPTRWMCWAGGLVYMGLKYTTSGPNLNLFLCVVTVVSLRIISKRKRLFLPEI